MPDRESYMHEAGRRARELGDTKQQAIVKMVASVISRRGPQQFIDRLESVVGKHCPGTDAEITDGLYADRAFWDLLVEFGAQHGLVLRGDPLQAIASDLEFDLGFAP